MNFSLSANMSGFCSDSHIYPIKIFYTIVIIYVGDFILGRSHEHVHASITNGKCGITVIKYIHYSVIVSW